MVGVNENKKVLIVGRGGRVYVGSDCFVDVGEVSVTIVKSEKYGAVHVTLMDDVDVGGVNGEVGVADVGYVEVSCVARCVCVAVLCLFCRY